MRGLWWFELICLDGSGCATAFEEKEIKKFLEKAFTLLDKLRTENELKEVKSLFSTAT